MTSDHPVKGSAGKAGFCDAIFKRESRTSFSGHYEKLNYEAGYVYGIESGAVYPLPEKQKPHERGGKGWQR